MRSGPFSLWNGFFGSRETRPIKAANRRHGEKIDPLPLNALQRDVEHKEATWVRPPLPLGKSRLSTNQANQFRIRVDSTNYYGEAKP